MRRDPEGLKKEGWNEWELNTLKRLKGLLIKTPDSMNIIRGY